MHRRISTFVKGSSSSYRFEENKDDDSDNKSTASTVVREEGPLPVPSLKIKRVDYYYSRWTKSWKYRVSTFDTDHTFCFIDPFYLRIQARESQ